MTINKVNIARLTFSVFNFISATLLIILIAFAVNIINQVLGDTEVPLLLGFISALITIAITALLGTNKKIERMFQKGNYNYRWLFIVLVASSFTIIMLVIFIIPADVLNFDLDNPATQQLLVFFLSNLLIGLVGYLIYFGVKNIASAEIHKIKFSIFASFSMLFLIVSGVGFGYLYTNFITFPSAPIIGGNGYNEGPWMTWHNNRPNDSICITWLTAESNSTILYYGKDPNNLDKIATGTAGNLHKVFLEGLDPNTMYHFSIPENFEQEHKVNIFNFTTASSTEHSFKFAIVGDMQPTNEIMMNHCAMVADGLLKGDFDFVCQIGDVADTGGDLEDWHRVLKSFARIGAIWPIQAIIGNHDWNGGTGSSNWGALFSYPYQDPSLGRHYSFDYYNAHFVMIDNFEHFYAMTDAQINWIEQDIIEAKARGQDWIFCIFHLSLMTTSTTGMYYDLQRQLVPIFDKQDIDAVFFGHDHDYQHYQYTYGWNGLVYDKSHNWDHNKIHYFCTGGGGANLEVDYGVLDENRMLKNNTVRWWDENTNQFKDIVYQRRSWDSSKYITHDSFEENYTHYAPENMGKYYYHRPEEKIYHDFAEQVELQYGEQCYHYIEIQISGNTCKISVKYPNGELLRGPGDLYPQQWSISK